MRLITEYEPARKLYLSFVHDFFITRFNYGSVQCEMIEAASAFVDVELFIQRRDQKHWQAELEKHPLRSEQYTLNFDSPRRAIVMEYVPLYAEDENGGAVGLVFRNPQLEQPHQLKRFSQRMVLKLGIDCMDMGFDFATANVSVNETVTVLTSRRFQGDEGAARLECFRSHFPAQDFHVVPSLAGDVTADLDIFLWPIKPRVWIASEYPSGSPQAKSMEPALHILQEYGHMVHRVTGLELIIYADINTLPNYANGVILNQAALVPAYR